MGKQSTIIKATTGVLGTMLILAGIGMIIYTQPYIESKTTKRLFEGASWLPIVFVYGACGAVVLLGVFQLASCKCKIPIYLVPLSLHS